MAPGVAASGVRVMTFNMRTDTEADADREGRDCRWAARRDLFLQVILRERPDLLGVQEAMSGQVTDLTDALSHAGYECYGQARGVPGEPSEGLFIAIRTPWRAARTGTFWLAVDTPEVPGSTASGAEFPRIAFWAALETADSERKLLFVNTHLDHPQSEVAEGNRTRSAEQIGKFVQQDEWAGWPVVITLDSNAEPGAPAHQKFIECGMIDSWAECNPDAAVDRPSTFHFFRGTKFTVPDSWAAGCWPGSLGPEGRKTCHIDWILHSTHLSAASCEIDRTEASEDTKSPPSDHFAVIASLHFS